MADGKIQIRGGKLLAANGKLTRVDSCCCGEQPPPPAPDECPDGLADCYYTDPSTFTGCANCLAPPNARCADDPGPWDGTMTASGACQWYMLACATIDGKSSGGNTPPSNVLELSGGKWLLHVYCVYDSPLPYQIPIWEGEKTTGLTPVGTYTRTGGCDTDATKEVTECGLP